MSELRLAALGGVGEIGKNCYVVEQGDDLIIIDCGLSFPSDEMFGVDIVIPDFTYLVQKRDNIRGVFLTHAHEDHVGSLPYLLKKLSIPVYATEFTHALIKDKLEEKVEAKRLILKTLKLGEKVPAGSLMVEPIRVTHSIPETCAMAIHTKHGVLLFTSDFKFDFTPVDNKLSQISRLAELAQDGVLCLLSDSTNVDRPGWGPSERIVANGLKQVFVTAPGRVLLTTFASNIHRMQQVYDMAAETGRVVGVVGRRMEQNVNLCERLGYLRIPKDVRASLDDLKMTEPNKQIILTTGSQGEPMSALTQMSRETYGRFRVEEGDTLIYSARPIPGNEAAIWRTINRLFKLGVNVLYDPVSPVPIHVSGHAYQEELKMMINLTKPFYLAPVHGEARHQKHYLDMAASMGYPEHRLFTLSDGVTLCFDENKAWLGDPIPTGRVLVDYAGNPGVSDEVMRDRNNLANDGVVTVTIALDLENGEVVGDPTLQAKGFNGCENDMQFATDGVADMLRQISKHELQDIDLIRHKLSDHTRRLLQKRTGLKPLVMPTIIEI